MPSTLSSSIIFPCPHNTLCCFFSTTKRGYRFSLVVVVDRKFTLGVLLGTKNLPKLLFRTSAFCTILGYPRLCNLLPATPKQTPPNTLLRKKEEIVRNFPSLVKNYDELSESTKCAMRYLFTTTTTLLTHSLRFLTAKLYTKRIRNFVVVPSLSHCWPLEKEPLFCLMFFSPSRSVLPRIRSPNPENNDLPSNGTIFSPNYFSQNPRLVRDSRATFPGDSTSHSIQSLTRRSCS